jgi:type IV fimbrial biogenesis protein FimT
MSRTLTPAARHSGFTIIELMITVAVLGIIVGLAVPSMRAYILNQRVRSVAFDLAASLLQARSEAGKRNENVSITQAPGGWQNGWTITLNDGSVVARRDPFQDIAITANYVTLIYQENGRVLGAGASPLFTVSTTDSSYLISISPRCVGVTLSGKVTNQC